MTGYFSESISIGDSVLISTDERDLFIAKYDTSGDFIWAFREGGSGYDEGKCIITTNESDFFLCGGFSENIILGDTILSSSDYVDFFIAKYNEPDQFKWAIHLQEKDIMLQQQLRVTMKASFM